MNSKSNLEQGSHRHQRIARRISTERPRSKSANKTGEMRRSEKKVVGIQVITKDITERKRAEHALANERNVLRTLIDTLPDNIFIKDTESRFVVNNLAHARLLRAKTTDEIVGKTDFDIFPRELAASYYADEQAVIQSGQPLLNREERTIDHEGKTRWLLTTKVPLRDDQGKITGLVGINRDITERKRAEEALANERNVLRTLIDNLPDYIFVKDIESRFITYNLAEERKLAHLLQVKTPDEIVGKRDIDIYPQELAGTYYADEQAVIRSGQPLLNREERAIDPEGKTRWVLTTKVPLRDDQGKVIGLVGISRDITERKRTEDALRESEQRLRRITDSMLDMVVETDPQGICKYASPSCKDVMGYDPKDLVGKSLFDFVHPEDLGTVAETIQRAVSTGRLWTGGRFECRYRHADGHHVWLENLANIVYDEKGQMIGGVIGSRDITERKRMEEKLRQYSSNLEQIVAERTSKLAESEKRFRELADLLPQTVFECDQKGDLTFANSNGLASLGYTEEDFRKGLNVFQMFVPEDRSRAIENFGRTQSGKRLSGNEYTILRKDGSRFPGVIYSSPVLHGDKPAGLRGIVVDITDRKLMEEQLRSAKERLEYVVTSNPAVIYGGKPRADLSDWELTYLSENVTNLLGYEAREFVGHPEFWTRVVHPMDRPSVLADVPSLWEKGRFIFEYRMRHKDGVYRWIREEANVIRDAEGKPIDVTGCWIDITELKRLEQTLLNSQRLAAIGETAMMVGHDLRNPLQAMTSTLYVVKKLATSDKVEDRKEALGLLGTLDDAIEYMDKIVSDLQDYARPVGAEPVETSLPDLVRTAISNAKIPGNVEVAVNVQSGLSKVKLDPALFRRVLTNLILNAVQAMPKGGKLTITGSREDDSLAVAVQDTGVGIAQENLGKVFTPFFTTKAKGQGLGLAVCKRLTEAQGGTITVTSQVGKGSTFTVTVPTSRAQAEA